MEPETMSITITITKQMHSLLAELAERDRSDVSQVINEAVLHYPRFKRYALRRGIDCLECQVNGTVFRRPGRWGATRFKTQDEIDESEINGCPVTHIYRADQWREDFPAHLFVTKDGRIWIGYGDKPESFDHIAHVRGPSRSRHAILIAARMAK